MASSSARSIATTSEQLLLMLLSLFLCVFLAFSVYDAVMAAAANLLQRFLVISPLLLVTALHWLMSSSRSSSSEPAGSLLYASAGSSSASWGVGLMLVLLCLAITYVPPINFWSCLVFQVFVGWVLVI